MDEKIMLRNQGWAGQIRKHTFKSQGPPSPIFFFKQSEKQIPQ